MSRDSLLWEYSASRVVSESGISSLNPCNKHPLLQKSNVSYLFLPCCCYAFRAGGTEDFREGKAESQLVSTMEQWLPQIRKATEIPAHGCKQESVILFHSDTWKKNTFDRKHCNFLSFKVLCPPQWYGGGHNINPCKWFKHFPLKSPYSRAKPPNHFPLTVFILHSFASARPKAPQSVWYGM